MWRELVNNLKSINRVAAIKVSVSAILFLLYAFRLLSIEMLNCAVLMFVVLVNIFEPPIVIVNQYIVEGIVGEEHLSVTDN